MSFGFKRRPTDSRLQRLKTLETSPPNRKISYGLIDFSSGLFDVLELLKCLRGSKDTHAFVNLGNVTEFHF